jgi:bifunctional ADP-heptose synthase (sugar kinase/adenylyltransferase)
VIRGAFDPLIAAHAERLAELKKSGAPLLVLISDAPNEILPAEARAQLVAGLAVVDYVAIESADGPSATIALEKEHAAQLEQLIERVHARQQA